MSSVLSAVLNICDVHRAQVFVYYERIIPVAVVVLTYKGHILVQLLLVLANFNTYNSATGLYHVAYPLLL